MEGEGSEHCSRVESSRAEWKKKEVFPYLREQ